MHSPILQLLAAHLPVLGFEVEVVEDPPSIMGRHKVKPSVGIRELRGGLYFLAPFPKLKNSATTEILILMNKISKDMLATRVYLNEDGTPNFEGWLPGNVDQAGITLFLDLFSDDISRAWDKLIQHLAND